MMRMADRSIERRLRWWKNGFFRNKKLNIRHLISNLNVDFFWFEKFMIIYAEFFRAPYFLWDFDSFNELTLMWNMCVVCANIKFIFIRKTRSARSPIRPTTTTNLPPQSVDAERYRVNDQRRQRRQFWAFFFLIREWKCETWWTCSNNCEFIFEIKSEREKFMTSKISQIFIYIQYFSYISRSEARNSSMRNYKYIR